MTGPLIDPAEAPAWLRGLVEISGDLDEKTFTRFAVPKGTATRDASVLILFGGDEAEPDVLLLRRADTLDSHAGQVAFPGGGAEEGDAGPVGTALREAEEETGVDPAGVRPIAVLPKLWVPVSRFVVTPVLAHWSQPSPVHAVDPGETAAVARVPLAELCDPANRFFVKREGAEWKGPAFDVGGLFVWGFTAGLLSVLLTLGGWEQEWDHTDVRDLDVALARHEARARHSGAG
ncbi:coenzyme A pyrophosphatase [Prauserella marina]|uniref:ADP-ribose pyrophosphatase YjhB, NUDIX family n=1 Tax=Prauserella marina TaxID=530584 RepID=A0A222VXH6_9PSEU|nr:CoA pyrophosphatase [Prauserella marina]ASR38401.1 coenzyme A pyrophosphatase [Prauserella marina]PWV78366.1 ADP-ribose pyrophosphatase YjhB (NUDIX family) [Prauserella marina]SDC84409.1 ADP-ribose pyrophosphatase YjhB, NUDIX family [Prauserella marina]